MILLSKCDLEHYSGKFFEYTTYTVVSVQRRRSVWSRRRLKSHRQHCRHAACQRTPWTRGWTDEVETDCVESSPRRNQQGSEPRSRYWHPESHRSSRETRRLSRRTDNSKRTHDHINVTTHTAIQSINQSNSQPVIQSLYQSIRITVKPLRQIEQWTVTEMSIDFWVREQLGLIASSCRNVMGTYYVCVPIFIA